MAAEEIKTFGLDNEEIRGGSFKKFQGKKGVTDRIGIVYTDPKAMFAGAKVHYNQRYFLCKKGACCQMAGSDPKWRVGAVLIKYATDNQGNPKTPFSYELFPWIFGEQTYGKLRTADSEFPLASHDIKVSCTNEEYQNLDIHSCKESIWQAKEEIKKRVIEEAKPYWDYIKKGIAADLSIEEIRELLKPESVAGTDPTTTLDLESVLKNV